MAFFEDVWSRNFLNISATPLTISEYLGGLVLSSIATSAVGLLVMLLLASTVFGLSFFAYGLALVQFLLALFVLGIALGVFACRRVVHLADSRAALQASKQRHLSNQHTRLMQWECGRTTTTIRGSAKPPGSRPVGG